MSTTKHTPGPWAWRRNRWAFFLSPGVLITGITGGTLWGDELDQANARLIAAAPDLLEALKGLLADIEDYQRVNNLGGESNHWQIIARAAISKAEGR